MPYMPRRRLIAYLQAIQTKTNAILANKQTKNFRFLRRSYNDLIALVKAFNVEYPADAIDLAEITRYCGNNLVKSAQMIEGQVDVAIAKSSQSTASTASSVSTRSTQSERTTASSPSSNSSSSSSSRDQQSERTTGSSVSSNSSSSSRSIQTLSSRSLSSQSLSSGSTASSRSTTTVSSASSV